MTKTVKLRCECGEIYDVKINENLKNVISINCNFCPKCDNETKLYEERYIYKNKTLRYLIPE